MGRVLDALERQLERVDAAQPFEPDALAEIVHYCQAYPAQMHHTKEDLLVARLRTRDAAAAAAAGDLEGEHERLIELTGRFTAAAQRLLGAPDARPERFLDLAKSFVNAYRSHIEAEERYLFPAALWSLTAKDWKDLGREIRALGEGAQDSATAAGRPKRAAPRKSG